MRGFGCYLYYFIYFFVISLEWKINLKFKFEDVFFDNGVFCFLLSLISWFELKLVVDFLIFFIYGGLYKFLFCIKVFVKIVLSLEFSVD